ncbi:MAG: hypothetical protein Q8Q09_26560 [Deltaproteobacteria bacterium]|nr:hypothetical protein [Deltaproteobacteria bacterium]
MVSPKKSAREPLTKVAESKARAEYAGLLREIKAAETDPVRGWDRKWDAIATVLQKRYFSLDPATGSAPLWLQEHAGVTYRTGLRNARVARIAGPLEAQRYTPTKIDLAYTLDQARRHAIAAQKRVTYAPPDPPEKVNLSALRYRLVRGGRRVIVGLADVSVAELRALLREATHASGATRARVSMAAKSLMDAIAADKLLRNITVQERDNELTLGRVRRDQWHALAKVLMHAAPMTE